MKKAISLLLTVTLIMSYGVSFAASENSKLMSIKKYIASRDENLPSVKYGTITITEGWNLIAMPVLPLQPYSVENFIRDVEKEESILPAAQLRQKLSAGKIVPSKIWRVDAFWTIKNGGWKSYLREGVTYNMIPGEAYWVLIMYNGPRPKCPDWRAEKKVKIAGKPVNISVSLNLDGDMNRGENYVSLMWQDIEPCVPPTLKSIKSSDGERRYSLRQLTKEFVEQGIKAKTIAFWSIRDRKWVIYDLPLTDEIPFPPKDSDITVTGETWDRLIRDDEGFYILCEENGLFQPALRFQSSIGIRCTGRVEYSTTYPGIPYKYVLVDTKIESAGAPLYLKPVDEAIERVLAQAANEGKPRTLAGVITYEADPFQRPIRVLLVKEVEPIFVKDPYIASLDRD